MQQIEFSITGVQLLALLVGTILPIIVGLVTKHVTSARVQSLLLLGLSALSGLGSELLASLQANETYDIGQGLLAAITTFIIGVAVHYGFWKPTGITEKALSVGDSGYTNPSRLTPGPDHRA